MLRRVDPLKFRVRGGFSLLDLKRFVDGRGYEGSGYGKLTLDSLVKLAPAIVPIQARDFKHFVVFRGIRHGRVLLADPAFGNRTMTTERFEDTWVEKVAFTVERRDGTVPPSHLAPDDQTILLPPNSFIRTQWR
jgi:predicted double-glycine peptidase